MAEVKLELDTAGKGAFRLYEDGKAFGVLQVEVTGEEVIVHHTEVDRECQGKGYGRKLFDAMVDYARTQGLKVKAYCSYVYAQLKRQPEKYADIWRPGQ